jgi:hypothetical protein
VTQRQFRQTVSKQAQGRPPPEVWNGIPPDHPADHMCFGPGHDDLHCFRVSGSSTTISLWISARSCGMDALCNYRPWNPVPDRMPELAPCSKLRFLSCLFISQEDLWPMVALGFSRIFATIGQRFSSQDAIRTWDWTGWSSHCSNVLGNVHRKIEAIVKNLGN